ncbi:MAG: MlaC/ttg2D family ABC transporter substrate-binding protein [Myxococcota bacterium]
MLQRLSRLTTAFLVAIGLVLSLSTAAMAGEPTEFIKDNAEEVSDLLKKKDSKQRSEKFSKKLHSLVDFRELADRALGEHWDARTEEEQDQFLALLQELLEANYKKKLEGRELGKDYEIKYLEEKARKDKAIVETKVVWSDGEESVEYKMLERKKSWVIYDIVIDDISLVETYRDSYTEIIEKEGWSELISRMEKKAEAIRKNAEKG